MWFCAQGQAFVWGWVGQGGVLTFICTCAGHCFLPTSATLDVSGVGPGGVGIASEVQSEHTNIDSMPTCHTRPTSRRKPHETVSFGAAWMGRMGTFHEKWPPCFEAATAPRFWSHPEGLGGWPLTPAAYFGRGFEHGSAEKLCHRGSHCLGGPGNFNRNPLVKASQDVDLQCRIRMPKQKLQP